MGAEVAHMKRVCGQATVLQERLSKEVTAQEVLRKEGAQLAARNSDLVALIHEALNGEGDVECTAFLNALSAENGMLWRLFHISRSASLASTASAASGSQTPTAYLRKQRPSLGTRTHSSSNSTPTCGSRSQAAESGQGASPRAMHSSLEVTSEDDRGCQNADAFISSVGAVDSVGGPAAPLPSHQAASRTAPNNLESGTDEDDVSEVSTLVETAMFMGTGGEPQSPTSEVPDCCSSQSEGTAGSFTAQAVENAEAPEQAPVSISICSRTCDSEGAP